MNWHYVRDGKQDGPHSEETMRDLLKTGAVNAQTLVWRDGMGNWEPISQAAPHLLPPAPGLSLHKPDPEDAVCSECGGVFLSSEMVIIRGAKVCARCKPLRLQKIQEGVPTGDRAAQLARLLKIAKAQRGVNMGILLLFLCYGVIFFVTFAGIAANPNSAGSPPGAMAILTMIAGLGVLAVGLLQILYVYRLASALEVGLPILWVLGVIFLSCIGVILLLILSSKATKQIKAGGFKVGLLGGNPKEIERAMAG